MKADGYLKVVLTVIAVCLVVIAFKPMFVTPAEASAKNVVDVNIAQIDGQAFGCSNLSYTFSGLPVQVTNR